MEPHEVKEISIKAFGEDVCMKEVERVYLHDTY